MALGTASSGSLDYETGHGGLVADVAVEVAEEGYVVENIYPFRVECGVDLKGEGIIGNP